MKRKLTINEELNRMKGLMSYENGQHKNPIISEQETTTEDLRTKNILKEEEVDNCTGNNEIDNVKVTVDTNPKNKNRYSFRITAFFPSTGSSDKIYGEKAVILKLYLFLFFGFVSTVTLTLK